MYHPRFKGSHYDIGLKFGHILKNQYVDFDSIIRLKDYQMDFGIKSERILQQVYPEICREIKGITDGLQYNYQKFSAWLLCMACCLKGCTAFCFNNKGHIIFGRNNDLPPELKKLSQSVLYMPDEGYSFLGNTSSMVHLEEGINEKGLVAAMTFVIPKFIKPGLNSVFIVRYILEKCADTKEAIATIKDIPAASAGNIILADKKGDMAIVEFIPGKINIRRPSGKERFLAVANDFISNDMKEHNDGGDDIYSSGERYKTAYSALKNINTKDNVNYAKNILAGEYGFMCRYKKETNCDTIWSSVFDLTENKIYRAEGNPGKVKFKEDKRYNLIMKNS
jgi:predicted choloylglycine hydrolase